MEGDASSPWFTNLFQAVLSVLGTAVTMLGGAFWWLIRERAETARVLDRLEMGLESLREKMIDHLDESQASGMRNREMNDAVIRLEMDVRALKDRLDRRVRRGEGDE